MVEHKKVNNKVMIRKNKWVLDKLNPKRLEDLAFPIVMDDIIPLHDEDLSDEEDITPIVPKIGWQYVNNN